MPPTGELARGMMAGDKLYQQRARQVLPILVRQAKAHRTITYGQLAAELEISNPRTLNWPLGAVGKTMLELGADWGRRIPPIQTVVINQLSGHPGEGIASFVPDAKRFRTASKRERELVLNSMLQDVYLFPDWDTVLDALGLPSAPGVPLPSVSVVARFAGGGEGQEHRTLKESVAKNPSWIGLPKRLGPGEIEARLYSGDSIDVLFSDDFQRIAVEVKTGAAPEAELIRGLFQCVKYEALVDAESRALGIRRSCTALLALGGSLPRALVPLQRTLGVTVHEYVGANSPQG